MAKVQHPLFSIDAWKQFGKTLIYRRGGIVTKYFIPRDPKSPAQLAQRQAFLENYVAGLTQEQADLLYAAIAHLHDGVYAPFSHVHDHGALSGLGDDDHTQYFNQTRGDARYSQLGHQHVAGDILAAFGGAYQVAAGTTMTTVPYASALFYANVSQPMVKGGTLKGLILRLNMAQPGTGSLVLTLEVNGSASGVVITVPAGDNSGTYYDNTNTVAVNQGDLIRWKFQNNASSPSAGITFVGMVLESSTG